ncbi:MAG: TolC family protein [Chlamydiia bacterium]|nr:TolC family protein [Chlamydiia bacterium]
MKRQRLLSLCSLIAATALTACSVAPPIDWCETRRCTAMADKQCLYTRASVPDHPLTLADIYEIANQLNLHLMAKQREFALQRDLSTREALGMLPSVRGTFTDLRRSKNTASFSESLQTGVPPAPLSISSETHQQRWDISAVWNYLDFGLAYYRSRQEYTKALAVQEEYCRQVQNLYNDIAREYWKAMAAKVAMDKSEALLQRARDQRAAVSRQREEQAFPLIQGLSTESFLVQFQGRFHRYERDYHSAMAELGLLMGLPPGVEFTLAPIADFATDVELDDLAVIEELALGSRPELYRSDLEEQVHRDDARSAALRMLPGAELYAGQFYDQNRFLLHNYWLEAGVRASWNLIDMINADSDKGLAQCRAALASDNGLIMSVAILSQVNLAWNIYHDNLDNYNDSSDLARVHSDLLKAAKREKALGKLNDIDLLKYEIEGLQVEVEHIRAYGDLQASLEQLNNAMGRPFHYRQSIVWESADSSETPERVTAAVRYTEEESTVADTEGEDVVEQWMTDLCRPEDATTESSTETSDGTEATEATETSASEETTEENVEATAGATEPKTDASEEEIEIWML